MTAVGTTVDEPEVAKFEAMAAEWWDPNGKFKPLHKLNPVRLRYIRDRLCAHFGRDPSADRPLADLRILDIGCGGGLVCEPMSRLGANVVGVDAAAGNIGTARAHARLSALEIDYRHTTAEDLAAAGETFDAILNLEVVEHVADLGLFLGACAEMVRPEGAMLVATINRTPKSFALAIVGAEYVLRWLPRGTHDWRKFVRPAEIADGLRPHGMDIADLIGVAYNPLSDEWGTSRDLAVNYMALAVKR